MVHQLAKQCKPEKSAVAGLHTCVEPSDRFLYSADICCGCSKPGCVITIDEWQVMALACMMTPVQLFVEAQGVYGIGICSLADWSDSSDYWSRSLQWLMVEVTPVANGRVHSSD